MPAPLAAPTDSRSRLSSLLDLRLVIPAAAAWMVAALLVGLTRDLLADVATILAVVFFAVAVVALVVVRAARARSARPGGRSPALLGILATSCAAVGLICSCLAAQLPARDPGELNAVLAHTVTVRVTVASTMTRSPSTGFVPNDSQPGKGSQLRFTATATSVRSGTTAFTARTPVLVFIRSSPGTPTGQIGDQLQLTGKLKRTEPGESVVYLFYAEAPEPGPATAVGATRANPTGASGAGGAVPGLAEAAPWYLAWANELRGRFRDAAAQLPGDGGQLVPGLAIGDVTLVSNELNDEMIASGLSHLTAVSGANCAIVVAAIMLLGGALSLSRRWRITVSLVMMAGFVVLVAPSSSVLRAAVMATIVLVTLASGRAPKGLPALALATIILLACDPWLARNYGLALSVLATAGLLVLTRPLQHALGRWMPGWLSLVIAVPLSAQLACQPVLILLSPTISTYSVIANLTAEPAAPVATVVGLVSCVVGAVVPQTAPVGAWLSWVPASWIAGVAHFFATAPGASLPWAPGVAGVLLVILLTTCALIVLLMRPPDHPGAPVRRESSFSRSDEGSDAPPQSTRSVAPRAEGRGFLRRRPSWMASRWSRSTEARLPRPQPSRRAVVRATAAALLLLAGAGYLGTSVGSTVLAGAAWPDNWEIAACDIGQGDAVVLHSHPPNDRDHYALVDVGPKADLLTTCLQRLDIEQIDLLVLTHYDLDHVGGLSAVVGRVGTVLMGPPDDAHDARMASTLRAGGADVRPARRGDAGAFGDVRWNILWPLPETPLRGNDASVTVQFTGAFRSLFLGDLGEDAQRQVAGANVLTHEDVVKVAHHGSADQSEPLYQAITAEAGLVSVGANNRYGHPTARLLGILARAGTLAYRTDQLGMLVLAPSAEGIVVWSEGQARVESKTK